jgi:hypothetical protein
MRILLHRLTDQIEVCPRLGLVLMPALKSFGGDRMVRHVLPISPAAAAGVCQYDVILSIDKRPLDSIPHLMLSERRASELVVDLWLPRYFKRAKFSVRIEPEPFAPIADIIAAAARLVAAHPSLPEMTFVNPRIADLGLIARGGRRGRT